MGTAASSLFLSFILYLTFLTVTFSFFILYLLFLFRQGIVYDTYYRLFLVPDPTYNPNNCLEASGPSVYHDIDQQDLLCDNECAMCLLQHIQRKGAGILEQERKIVVTVHAKESFPETSSMASEGARNKKKNTPSSFFFSVPSSSPSFFDAFLSLKQSLYHQPFTLSVVRYNMKSKKHYSPSREQKSTESNGLVLQQFLISSEGKIRELMGSDRFPLT